MVTCIDNTSLGVDFIIYSQDVSVASCNPSLIGKLNFIGVSLYNSDAGDFTDQRNDKKS